MWHWAWKDSRAGSRRGTCGEGSDHCDCTQQRKCDHSKEAVLTVEKWGRSRRAEQRGEGGRGEGGRERRGWREGIQERRGKRGGSKGGGHCGEQYKARHNIIPNPLLQRSRHRMHPTTYIPYFSSRCLHCTVRAPS